MTAKAILSAGMLAVVTVACGYSIKTATDYDRQINFSNYQSFSILKGNSSGNPLMDQRAQDDVRSALTAKGWKEVPEGQGQTTVVVHAATKTKHTYETMYDGFGGGWGWRRGWGWRLRWVDDVRQRLQGWYAGGRHFRCQDKAGNLARLGQRCTVEQCDLERQSDRAGDRSDVGSFPPAPAAANGQ